LYVSGLLIRALPLCLTLSLALSAAEQQPAAAPPRELPASSWLDALWDIPVFRLLAPLFDRAVEPEPLAEAAPPLAQMPACAVAPLNPIEDPAAQQLEAASESDQVADIPGMDPAAARALDRFQSRVAAAGGTLVLKSAFRPAAYQEHLQDVWYKWMTELRDNTEPACAEQRGQAAEEFARHRLIETQHPVTVSDHTRGLAFDAAVALPARARLGRRRVTLDRLARLSGLVRPAIAADPVHFKYVGVSPSRLTVRVNRRRRPGSVARNG
jgi:D-alanyl-D-alanine dipeptidase